MAGTVEFAGFVDDEHLRAAYRDCALFALPSSGEGFGIVFLEAMAHGKPCLGAAPGPLPEIIDDRSGVLVDPGDIAPDRNTARLGVATSMESEANQRARRPV